MEESIRRTEAKSENYKLDGLILNKKVVLLPMLSMIHIVLFLTSATHFFQCNYKQTAYAYA